MAIKAILSDIGKVVVPFDNSKTFRAFADITGCSPAEVERAFFGVGRGALLLDRYERGHITTESYQKIICSRLNVAKAMMPTAEEFHAAYSDVFDHPHEVPAEWRRLADAGVKLVAISNICEMRYRWLADKGTFDVFHPDARVLSYVEGHRKPSAELVIIALDRAGCAPEEALFVDDIHENLVPAQALGVETHHFVDVAGLFACLHGHGLRDTPHLT